MRPKNTIWVLLAVMLLGGAVAAFFLTQGDFGVEAEVAPTSTAFSRDGAVGGITICTADGSRLNLGSQPATAFVHITGLTELIDQRRRSPARFQLDDLQPGSRIRIWTNGQVEKSSPPQTTATRIILRANPTPSNPTLCQPTSPAQP
jgi:hypothetical protein